MQTREEILIRMDEHSMICGSCQDWGSCFRSKVLAEELKNSDKSITPATRRILEGLLTIIESEIPNMLEEGTTSRDTIDKARELLELNIPKV